MIVSCAGMRAIEERAFSDGINAEALMEDAGWQIAEAVRQFIPGAGRVLIFFGKGNNGGDALVAARHLAAAGWELEMRPAFPRSQWGGLTAMQHRRVPDGTRSSAMATSRLPLVVLDGLLGIGAGGALREPIRGACEEINRLRRESAATVFAVDIPTGLDGDTGARDEAAVSADFTLTIGFAKTGLVVDHAINHVGRLAVLPLAELTLRSGEPVPGQAEVATPFALAPLVPSRNFDTHKGQCGRVGVLAGSRGFTGAAVMCAEAAVRGGAGLVTLYVPKEVHGIVATRITPEVMVHAIDHPLDLLSRIHDVLAVGPGLGTERANDVRELIERAPQPMVCDADALNVLAEDPGPLQRAQGERLLTPHPGEMARLDPGSTGRSRRETVELFMANHPHVLLLKGARTLIGQRGKPLSYNSTGHPGMASGGMGDVTTGLLAALAGQGLSLYETARVGAWIAGRAAERALWNGPESAQSLRATAVLDHLGGAFTDLRRRCF